MSENQQGTTRGPVRIRITPRDRAFPDRAKKFVKLLISKPVCVSIIQSCLYSDDSGRMSRMQ
jgi:hypothetical protein